MLGYIFRRTVQALIVILGVTLIVFLLGQLIPGGQARAALGPKATPLQIHHYNVQYGLNQPIWVQYWHYLLGLFKGNLGYSVKRNQTVAASIWTALPRTILLVGVSTLFALVIAIPVGVSQAVRRNSIYDYTMTGISFFLYAIPAFLIATLLIIWFSFDLGWFPSSVPTDAGVWAIFTDPRSFVLPVFSLAALTIASYSRYMRSSVLDTLTEDYIRTARAKGAGSNRVLYGHALRNALLPLLTLIGLTLPAIVGGAVIIEDVFNYPGMGLLTVQAANNDDIPLVLGTTLVLTVATVIGSLLADLLYAAADPRIRLGNE